MTPWRHPWPLGARLRLVVSLGFGGMYEGPAPRFPETPAPGGGGGSAVGSPQTLAGGGRCGGLPSAHLGAWPGAASRERREGPRTSGVLSRARRRQQKGARML